MALDQFEVVWNGRGPLDARDWPPQRPQVAYTFDVTTDRVVPKESRPSWRHGRKITPHLCACGCHGTVKTLAHYLPNHYPFNGRRAKRNA